MSVHRRHNSAGNRSNAAYTPSTQQTRAHENNGLARDGLLFKLISFISTDDAGPVELF